MRYGHSIGTDFIYSPFFTVGLLVLAIIAFFIVFMAPTRTKPEHERILDILNVRYAKNEIDDDKYYEVKSILQDEDSDSSAIILLKERYACGNLSSIEFVKMRDTIKTRKTALA
ncbi:hypothetical protein E4K67_02620 [Desulfosporosinus fructosivorans]|uniref:SHOCT domain-containing protein n=1 Tax=Desulfosporosinus fructosivorans TaxID=2018669 RepID=A0A4Z0RCJ0_9FIRM|nr:hypothetical protein [Desulfosporosinus fructosivorans]TGE39897.1 hypothetical protein E4K67_02620 [Desulfosporosinus fructosivorans]